MNCIVTSLTPAICTFPLLLCPQHDVSVWHVGEQERHVSHRESPTPAGRQLLRVSESSQKWSTQYVRVQWPVIRYVQITLKLKKILFSTIWNLCVEVFFHTAYNIYKCLINFPHKLLCFLLIGSSESSFGEELSPGMERWEPVFTYLILLCFNHFEMTNKVCPAFNWFI